MTRVSAWIVKREGFVRVIPAVIAVLAFSGPFFPALRKGELVNPDSYMRLARLRDGLDAGTLAHGVARDGSGLGDILHWSHLLDSLLYLLALPFMPFLGAHGALHAAALIFGPLMVIAAAWTASWAAAPFAERQYLWLGAVLLAVSPAIIGYGTAGVVHHHVPAVLAVLGCWGWAARLARDGAAGGGGVDAAAVGMGACAGLGCWLTPETMPMSLMAFGGLGLLWLMPGEAPGGARARDLARGLGVAGLAFALVLALALIDDPPAGGPGAIEIDRVSLLFMGAAWAVAATGAVIWIVGAGGGACAHPPVRARFLACAAGFIFIALWALVFRDVLFGPGLIEDPALWHVFFDPINEMRPVTDPLLALNFLFTGVLTLAITLCIAWRRRSMPLGYVALCLALMLWQAQTHVRFAAWPEAAAATILPIAMTLAAQFSAVWHPAAASFLRMAVFLGFVQLPYAYKMPDLAGPARAAGILALPSCRVGDALPLLASHAGEVVLTDVNDAPELLYRAHVLTVGSLYHRNIVAFQRMRAAWRSAPSVTVPAEITEARITLVLACESPVRVAVVQDLPGDTLFDQVRTGRPPPWLTRIGENPASGLVLYKVVRTDP